MKLLTMMARWIDDEGKPQVLLLDGPEAEAVPIKHGTLTLVLKPLDRAVMIARMQQRRAIQIEAMKQQRTAPAPRLGPVKPAPQPVHIRPADGIGA